MHSHRESNTDPVVIIGAGPAGLTAALELCRQGVPVVIFEADTRVGGLAQTAEYRGYRFDIGGHRFYTKVAAVRDLWREMLGPDFIRRPRLSRIFYGGRFYDYPLRPLNALRNLGMLASIAILASYTWVKLFPVRPEVSFADWVSNRFGRRLFRTFFESYTEKVWGIPCTRISAQWAAQRIKGLSLRTAVLNMLFPGRNRKSGQTIKTLIDEFEYPRLGPGMMWDAFAREITARGGRLELGARVSCVHHDGSRVTAVEAVRNGQRILQPAQHVISSMPARQLVESFEPAAPGDIVSNARHLHYRDFITVALIVDAPDLFPDNWIYIHDPSVTVGRIQNFKNWSPDMVPDARTTCVGLEYFCTVGDTLWNMSDEQLLAQARRELAAIGLARVEQIVDGTVVRMPKAYPVYDDEFRPALDEVRHYVARFSNLQLVGRNGTHKYNNQDHSMVMAMLAVRNFFGEQHDLWALNADDEYQEEVREGSVADAGSLRALAASQPLVPATIGAARLAEHRPTLIGE
jgi:protoporphyrinogen oxidase